MGTHRQIFLEHINEPDLYTLAGYERLGGYQAFRKAVTMEPQAIIEEVKASGLRGRGGAAFPTGTNGDSSRRRAISRFISSIMLMRASPAPSKIGCFSKRSLT